MNVRTRSDNPDDQIFARGGSWDAVIDLEDGETLESIGYSRTGKTGLPGPGFAFITPDGKTIYVRSGKPVDGEVRGAVDVLGVYSDWEILSPNKVIA